MIETLNFQTRARTLDHLGREQIADVPTAISELWKNAYDAYATHVNLSLYDGGEEKLKPIVVISDDGHGMNYNEFVTKWLVIGTETKLFGAETPLKDKFGLTSRPKQGQKGIGRLSSAHLGPLLLLVSKRKEEEFVISLIDWRVFENPYLLLSDIKVPVTTVSEKADILAQLPSLFDSLMENIWGLKGDVSEADKSRTERVVNAWAIYDSSAKEEFKQKSQSSDNAGKWKAPSEEIADTIISSQFNERHLEAWTVWNGESSHGTAMLISEVNKDFLAYIPEGEFTGTEEYIKDRFFQTLTAFVDPYHDNGSGKIVSREVNGAVPDFDYEFDVVLGKRRESIIGHKLPIDRQRANEMEHVLFGTIDENGDFEGSVKSFSKWRKTDYAYKVAKPTSLIMPTGANNSVGRCDIYISTFELEVNASTHEDSEHTSLRQLADDYAVFMIFRDGLRVLPYGREESDFFEVETRRSKNAGRYFWNKRRMFGRLALTRQENPNLRDKAGREGFIDNSTAKALKAIIINILTQAADDYFGRKSDIRKNEHGDIKAKNKEEKAAAKAEADAKRLLAKRKKEFNNNVEKANLQLPDIIEDYEGQFSRLKIETSSDIDKATALLDIAREKVGELKVRGAKPKKITRKAEKKLETYKDNWEKASKLIERFAKRIDADVERIAPKQAWEILEGQIKRGSSQITRKLTLWEKELNHFISREIERVSELKKDRSQALKNEAAAVLKLVRDERESLSVASKKVEKWRDEIDEENREIFEGYIFALESLKDSIDLQNVALRGADENEALKVEVQRLNELAQLGIAVEILGHELQSYDNMIGSGINALPKEVKESRAVRSIETGYEGLTKQLNFLAPLKISGRRSSQNITGQDIFEYLQNFFSEILERREIDLIATGAFLEMSVYEQPARLFPVFINLVNNSQYWVFHSGRSNKQIVLDVVDDKVVVSDNGLGIEAVDHSKLFQLFFTRKASIGRGEGRGVGLYLCRANLRAGGHDIEYVVDTESMPLTGANFAITFSNVEFGVSG